MISTQRKAFAAVDCDVAFDNLTRQLYATDASIYQIEPQAVAFPRNARQAGLVIMAAAEEGMPITPRGAGTGLCGGAIGDGLVIDFSRYNRQITDLDLECRTVHAGAGVVLDQLTNFLKPHGYCFGPDVATSSRATIGGMIANNSSGAYTPVYGTTVNHVNAVEIVLADGRVVTVGPDKKTLPRQREVLEMVVQLHSLHIAEMFPKELSKRWPGYGFATCLSDPGNLANIIAGSEGTLAAITSAKLKIVPLPGERGVGILFFDSIADAMQATTELLDLNPAAIEHIDRVLLDQTRGQVAFQAARDLLDLDHRPCESLLIVEFFEHAPDKLRKLDKRRLGVRKQILHSAEEANRVWAMRKAGLSLLTGCKGGAKPVTCIEDSAVLPAKLPEYVAALQKILSRLGLHASFYGHAASGLLHVRPVLDLHSASDLKKFRQISDEASALVKQFKGSVAAEHGVGMAHTEYLREHVGDVLWEAMREIKTTFDPHNLFNPGKIISDGRFKVDGNLRWGADYKLKLPFEPVLAFAAKDESFIGNLEQCNGCGGCRKESAMMCPTFIVTGEEIMSTRGRANAIRAALEFRGERGDPLRSEMLEAALSNCLSCKACETECPSNVSLPLIKAELSHARIQRDGLSVRERLFSSVDALGKFGCAAPWLMNAALRSPLVRGFMEKAFGITSRRPLSHYARWRFDHWFAERSQARIGTRGRVVLWDDTFVRYNEPKVGMAAVRVLEAAGYKVELQSNRVCCGRPAFSQGNLDEAKRLGAHNLLQFNHDVDNAPIIFLEPSCHSMFVEDYRELKLPTAERIAKRCFLFEEFIEHLLEREPDALKFNSRPGKVVIHAHCHVKAHRNPSFMRRLAERLPEREVVLLDSGCCGMAGAFGALESKYDLSVKVAEPLIRQVTDQPFGTNVVASGASCRQQISHLANVRLRHMAELLAESLA